MTAARGTLAGAAAVAAAAMLLTGCGGVSSLTASLAGSSPSASPSAGSLQPFREVVLPMVRIVTADAGQLANDAGDPAASRADADKLWGDVTAWAVRIEQAAVPARYQPLKNELLRGLDQLRTSAGEYSSGLPGNTLRLWRGQSGIQVAIATIAAVAANLPATG
jgi:hypothetical protein